MEQLLLQKEKPKQREALYFIDTKDKERILVAGDIHGDYESFENILKEFDYFTDILIFLGDYADRGLNGVEVIKGIYDLIERHPDRIIALKGNHEDYKITCLGDEEPIVIPTFSPCTLIDEVKEKFERESDFWCKIFKPFVQKTYLAAIIPNEILFVHGGVSSKIQSIDDLKYPSSEVEKDILWSDPFDDEGERPNSRGAGVEFGKNVSKDICKSLDIKRIVRSHQPRKAASGPYVEHDGRVITTSATRVYGGRPFLFEIPLNDVDKVFKEIDKHTIWLDY